MLWFKHFCDAHRDAKLQKVLLRFGIAGYGLYFYLLELIGREIKPGKADFRLYHDAEIIGHDLNLRVEHVNEIVAYFIDLGLLQRQGDDVFCDKMADFMDSRNTRSTQLKQVIQQHKTSRTKGDSVKTKGDSVKTKGDIRPPDIDLDLEKDKKNILVKTDVSTESGQNACLKKQTRKAVVEIPVNPEFEEFWKSYPRKAQKKRARKVWEKINPSPEVIKNISANLTSRKKYESNWNGLGDQKYIPHPATYLNGEMWLDELDFFAATSEPEEFIE